MTDLSLGRHANDPIVPLEQPAAEINPAAVIGAEIIIEQLHKFYGSVKVLEDLDLHIQPGEFLAIVGRSGCGKSTLLRLIADLEQQSYGEIKFKSARHIREGITADDIRVMFQDPRLLPWRSIEQNVQLGLGKEQHAKASANAGKGRPQRKSRTVAFTAFWRTTATYRLGAGIIASAAYSAAG